MGSRLSPESGAEQIKSGRDASDIKGTISQGVDDSGKARPLTMTGVNAKLLRVLDENSHLLKELLLELKINNYILNEVHDLSVTEKDIKN